LAKKSHGVRCRIDLAAPTRHQPSARACSGLGLRVRGRVRARVRVRVRVRGRVRGRGRVRVSYW